MNSQLVAGNTGGKRMYDTVGRGSLEFDEKLRVFIPKEVRARAKCSVADMLRRQGSGSVSGKDSSSLAGPRPLSAGSAASGNSVSPVKGQQEASDEDSRVDSTAVAVGDTHQMDDTRPKAEDEEEQPQAAKRKIFDNLVIYVNGSTHPSISDHKLKHLLAENGARMSFHLGRRQVTHVILGRPAAAGHGAGGGLAGGKLEKEIRKVGGCGIKYVGVDWYGDFSFPPLMEICVYVAARLRTLRFCSIRLTADITGSWKASRWAGGCRKPGLPTSKLRPGVSRASTEPLPAPRARVPPRHHFSHSRDRLRRRSLSPLCLSIMSGYYGALCAGDIS